MLCEFLDDGGLARQFPDRAGAYFSSTIVRTPA